MSEYIYKAENTLFYITVCMAVAVVIFECLKGKFRKQLIFWKLIDGMGKLAFVLFLLDLIVVVIAELNEFKESAVLMTLVLMMWSLSGISMWAFMSLYIEWQKTKIELLMMRIHLFIKTGETEEEAINNSIKAGINYLKGKENE